MTREYQSGSGAAVSETGTRQYQSGSGSAVVETASSSTAAGLPLRSPLMASPIFASRVVQSAPSTYRRAA